MPEKELKLNKELPIDQEKKEEPEISFKIFYSPHGTAKDFEKLTTSFSEADVYVPENISWTPEILAELQALSQGEKTPEELITKHHFRKNSSWTKDLEIIYQSQKTILFADLGTGHKLEDMSRNTSSFYRQAWGNFKQGSFSEALREMRDFILSEAEFQKQREKIMMDNLKIQLENLVKNKEFENKKEIRVLLSLGDIHTYFPFSQRKNASDQKKIFKLAVHFYKPK